MSQPTALACGARGPGAGGAAPADARRRARPFKAIRPPLEKLALAAAAAARRADRGAGPRAFRLRGSASLPRLLGDLIGGNPKAGRGPQS